MDKKNVTKTFHRRKASQIPNHSFAKDRVCNLKEWLAYKIQLHIRLGLDKLNCKLFGFAKPTK
jgi:hypothetical protein